MTLIASVEDVLLAATERPSLQLSYRFRCSPADSVNALMALEQRGALQFVDGDGWMLTPLSRRFLAARADRPCDTEEGE